MSTPLLFITSSFLFLLSTFSICRNGVNCHSHGFHFIPSICQRVECECVCTWLVGTKCTRDFPAREMVIFRRQELIIRLCHPFRSLNVDPHGSSYRVVCREQGYRQCCCRYPIRHQRMHIRCCGELRVFIIRDEFRFGSFRRFLTVGLFHFRRECICRCDSGRGGENSLPLLIRCRRPIEVRTKFSGLAVSVTSLSFSRLLLASVTVTLYVCLVLPSATARLPITSILEMVAVVLSATNVTDCAFEGWSFPADAVIS